MLKRSTFAIAIAILCLSSCDERPVNPTPPPNFEIVSSETFKVLATYENGWIKDAVQNNLSNNPLYEFSYHDNGYLKNYKLYREYLQGDAVLTVLYMQHERTAEDLPVSTKYYDVHGNVFATLLFEDGLLASKEIKYDNITTTFLYQHGTVVSVDKINSETEEKTFISYDHINNKKTLTFTIPGSPGYTLESNLATELGAGYTVSDDISLLNLLEDDNDYVVTPVNTGGSGSISRKGSVNFKDLLPAPVNYYALEDDFVNKFGNVVFARDIKRLLNSDLNRSVHEQYPFVEGTALIANSETVENQYSLKASLSDVIEKTDELKEQYEDDFETLYGNGYVTRYYTGKNLLIVGTIRNLPSDLTLRSMIIDAAETYANDLITNRETLTAEQEELLSHVFFQLKAHSNLLEANGRVIKSHQDYESIVDHINTADAPIIHVVLSRHF